MRRVSKEQLARRPSLKGKDLENARIACEKFQNIPVAMMNFPEGTRFTPAKREARNSPYQHLLTPRIGGIGQTLYALSDQLDGLIDVTVVYPDAFKTGMAPTFWDLVSGQIPKTIVRAKLLEIPSHLRGRNFRTDTSFRRELEAWIKLIWIEKDALITELSTG